MTKTFSNASNAARGARAALKNQSAKPGTDFQVDKGEDGRFTFKLLVKKARTKREPGAKSPIRNQPNAIKLVDFLKVAAGRTVEECAGHLGGIATHTVRGMVSRLRSEGVAIEAIREGRSKRYKAAS